MLAQGDRSSLRLVTPRILKKIVAFQENRCQKLLSSPANLQYPTFHLKVGEEQEEDLAQVSFRRHRDSTKNSTLTTFDTSSASPARFGIKIRNRILCLPLVRTIRLGLSIFQIGKEFPRILYISVSCTNNGSQIISGIQVSVS